MQAIKGGLGQTGKLLLRRPCTFLQPSRAGMAETMHGVWGALQCGCRTLQRPTWEVERTAYDANDNMLKKGLKSGGCLSRGQNKVPPTQRARLHLVAQHKSIQAGYLPYAHHNHMHCADTGAMPEQTPWCVGWRGWHHQGPSHHSPRFG